MFQSFSLSNNVNARTANQKKQQTEINKAKKNIEKMQREHEREVKKKRLETERQEKQRQASILKAKRDEAR